jgi:hypothetical protein
MVTNMLQQITSLLHSPLFSERRNGIKLLASYLQQAAGQPEPQQQVTVLVSEALSEQNDLMQQETLELLLNYFNRIQFDARYLLPPLIDIYKGKQTASHSLVMSILVKILETNAYPARDLILKFFDGAARGQILKDQGVLDLLYVLGQVTPVHGTTKQLYFDLIFNTDSVPVHLPPALTTKFQQVVGTHFWGLEHQRKVRQVEIAQIGVTFPVESEFFAIFRGFVAALTKASKKSPMQPELLDDILKQFPPFPLDQCLSPFFFIEVMSVIKHHVGGETDEFDIAGILKTVLPVNFSLIGTEAATKLPSGLASTVTPKGEFYIHVQIQKVQQNYTPFTFYVDILGKQVSLVVPFEMPRPGDPALHDDVYAGEETRISISAGTNGDYMTSTCFACGEKNDFRIEEIAHPAPLYCKSCGVLLKRQGELHLI